MSASAERRPRAGGEDVIVALDRPAELLSVAPEAMLERDARIEPGADEIVNELLGRSKVQRRARIVVTLPAEQVTAGVAETLQTALHRYCEARLARVQREIEVAWRQGLRSLGRGSILFLVGLLLSTGFWSRTFRSSGEICSATESSPSSAGSVFGIRSTCSSSPDSR